MTYLIAVEGFNCKNSKRVHIYEKQIGSSDGIDGDRGCTGMVAGVGPGIDTSWCGCRYRCGCGCGCRVRVSGAAPVRDLDRHGNGSRNGGEGRKTKLLRGEQSRGRNIQLFMPAAPYHAYIVSAGHTYTWLLRSYGAGGLKPGSRKESIIIILNSIINLVRGGGRASFPYAV